MLRRVFRPRVLVYTAILWAIIIAAAVTLYQRVPLKVDVIRDRANVVREVDDGEVENVYRLQIMNTDESPREFTIGVSGLDGMKLDLRTAADPPRGRQQPHGAGARAGGARCGQAGVQPDRVHHPSGRRPASRMRSHWSFTRRPPSWCRKASGRQSMSEIEHRLHGRPWYREPWPWILMSGPLAVVVAGLVTAWIAVVNDDPLVVDNYYKEGLAINRVLERDHAAAQGGYRAELMLSRDGARVRAHLSGAAPERLRLSLVHPTRAELDRTVELLPLQAGWYEGEIGLAAAPRWRVVLEDRRAPGASPGSGAPRETDVLVLAPRS